MHTKSLNEICLGGTLEEFKQIYSDNQELSYHQLNFLFDKKSLNGLEIIQYLISINSNPNKFKIKLLQDQFNRLSDEISPVLQFLLESTDLSHNDGIFYIKNSFPYLHYKPQTYILNELLSKKDKNNQYSEICYLAFLRSNSSLISSLGKLNFEHFNNLLNLKIDSSLFNFELSGPLINQIIINNDLDLFKKFINQKDYYNLPHLYLHPNTGSSLSISKYLVDQFHVNPKAIKMKATNQDVISWCDEYIEKNSDEFMFRDLCKANNLEEIKRLHTNGFKTDYSDDKLLMLAIYYESLDIVKYLVERGIDIHKDNDLPLTFSLTGPNLDITKYLLSQGANIHANNDYLIRFVSESGYFTLDDVKYLVAHGANIHANENEALRNAAQRGALDIVKYLIEQGCDIKSYQEMALNRAAYQGQLNVVEYFLETDPHLTKNTALIYAAINGQLDVIKKLVEYGANLHTHDSRLLYFASKSTNIQLMDYLITNGVDQNQNDLLGCIVPAIYKKEYQLLPLISKHIPELALPAIIQQACYLEDLFLIKQLVTEQNVEISTIIESANKQTHLKQTSPIYEWCENYDKITKLNNQLVEELNPDDIKTAKVKRKKL